MKTDHVEKGETILSTSVGDDTQMTGSLALSGEAESGMPGEASS